MGKITVKHFLNTRANPIKDEKGNEMFPIFIMVIYDRMTIRKRSIHLSDFFSVTEKDFENKKYSKSIKNMLEYEKDLIYKVVDRFKNDIENNCVSKNFLNFNSKNSYTSENENLNLLNSYINYYTARAEFYIILYSGRATSRELEANIEKSLDFSQNKSLLKKILNIVNENDFSEWADIFPYDTFMYNNISEQGKKIMFLQYCFSNFVTYRKTEYCALYEWFYEYDKVAKEYKKAISKNEEILEVAQANNFDLEKELNFQLLEIKKLFSDPLFHEKYKV